MGHRDVYTRAGLQLLAFVLSYTSAIGIYQKRKWCQDQARINMGCLFN